MNRTATTAGKVQMEAEKCVFSYERLRPGALLVTITGHDNGQFGSATLDEIPWSCCATARSSCSSTRARRWGQP
ncbi:MAG TPA: hypothetical protein VHK47_00105 [Polyangia bacterium]|nr:hypothetical protein [Polyangia bacterium]